MSEEGTAMGAIAILEKQGLRVVKGPGPSHAPAYFITDPEDGKQYILTYDEAEDLLVRGKLGREGLREHDERIKKNGR